MRQDEPPVVGGGQHAGPRVEQLDRARARGHLDPQERRGDLREPAQQPVPEVGGAVHQRLGAGMVPRGAALDQVTGQGERRAGEPDQRCAGELPDELPHGSRDVGHIGGLQWPQRVQIGSVAERCGEHRPDAGHDVDADTDSHQRYHDVGEEDRRVHPVPPDRLHRDLRDQIRPGAGFQHSRALPQHPVLR